MARLQNSLASTNKDPLSSLLDLDTGDIIPNFPATSSEIDQLNSK